MAGVVGIVIEALKNNQPTPSRCIYDFEIVSRNKMTNPKLNTQSSKTGERCLEIFTMLKHSNTYLKVISCVH